MKHEKDESIELNLNCGHVWVLHERPLYRESMPKWRDIFVIYKHRASASECVWYVYTHDRRQYLWNAIFVTSIMQRIRTSCAYAIFQIVFFTLSWDYVGSHLASPGHHQPWQGLSKIGRSLSYTRKDFNYLRRVNVAQWYRMWIYAYASSE